LGECFWKKNDLQAAKNCFVGAMEQSKVPNKDSLRNLSMVLRQMGTEPVDKKANILESVKKAKESVALDVKDGMSWYILGNAYLAHFFQNTSDQSDKAAALKAFQQAETCSNSTNNPDLHYNRAVIFKYSEDYQLAFAGFSRASSLDSSWVEPTREIRQIWEFVDKVLECLAKKAWLKPKKLSSLVRSLLDTPPSPAIVGAVIPFTSLKEGSNTGKVLVTKVAHIFTSKDYLPMSLAIIDKDCNFLILSIFNIAEKTIHEFDSVNVVDPILRFIKLSNNENKESCYSCVQVDYSQLVVNGKVLGSSNGAPTSIKLDNIV